MSIKTGNFANHGAQPLLGARDWAYLLSLLIPFVIYDLVLRIHLIATRPRANEPSKALVLMQIPLQEPRPSGFTTDVGLIQSDLFFSLGYVCLWIGLFAALRKGLFRPIIVVLFHLATVCVVLISTIAYQYFNATGSTLNSETVVLGVTAFDELGGLIASEASAGILALVVGAVVYSLIAPPLAAYLVWQWARQDANHSKKVRAWSRPFWTTSLLLGATTFFGLSLLPGVSSTGVSKSFARDAVVNVMVTSIDVAQGEELPEVPTGLDVKPIPQQASLVPASSNKRRNVVLIFLESTRASATTPYNKALPTTPFLDELAKRSLLVERAYAVIPHTHNALTAINCGIYPPLDAPRTRLLAIPSTLPDICLPHLLKAQGYNTAYFMSQVKTFENSQQILENLGYEDFYSLEHMNTVGFEPTNYFGLEDEVMLEPSRAWLEQHRDEPFLTAYLTSAPHHDYLAPQKRYGRVAYTDDDVVNRYLNSVRNQDFFLKHLFDQYRQLGLYEDTIFVLLGDHGQGFGEHGRNGHDNAIYEEGLRIPLLIHDPQRYMHGERIEGPVTQLDILPTVADLLGYQIQGGPYNGTSFLRPLPENRTLMFSCSGEKGCMASLKGYQKFIYHFDDRPEEFFNLASDPAEQMNLAAERAPSELKKWRAELVEWRAKVRAMYDAVPGE